MRIYQRFISPARVIPCPMHPSCSNYAYEAFNRYNPLKAFMMTADRLHRCGHDLDNYEKVEVSEFTRFFDPPYALSLNTTSSSLPADSSLQVFKEPGGLALETPADTFSEDSRLFQFAQALESEGDYMRALIEYRRLVFYFPDSPYRKQAMKSILRCYYKAEQYLSATHWGQELLSRGDMVEEESEIKFFMGLSFFRLNNHQLARKYFNEIITTEKDSFKEKSILLEGLSYAKEEKWEEAEKSFALIKPDSTFFNNANQSIELSKQGKKLRKKSPTVAGFLSIIPGLGYLYSGYEQTALASFIVNGLFIWGTIEAFDHHNEGLGIMLGVLSFGWYSGNIYGSVVSAERSNQKSKNELLIMFELGFEF
ncbi:MAG: membrane protein insertion efficiency factor YidD [Nitrospirae bacterium]|nr:membrane protein insertion efficiency factor YidD [Nitrospirota bacterium]